MAVAFLYFQIKEYAFSGAFDATVDKKTFITNLSFTTYLSTNPTKLCNFTYNAGSTVTTYQSNPVATPFYNSTCFDGSVTGFTTTATVAEFKTFDAVKIYYNGTLYATIDSAALTKYGAKAATLTDFFQGKHADFDFQSQTTFAGIAPIVILSTTASKLFIAKFEGDYSYLTVTVVDKTLLTTNCTMYWTSLNETVCTLAAGEYVLYGKDSQGKVVIRYPFTREFTVGGTTIALTNHTVFRQLIPFSLPAAPVVTNTTDFKAVAVLQTTFYVNMNDTTYKTIDLNDQTCENVTTTITSNGTVIFSGYTHKYCYLAVTSSTAALIPHTDFVINATYSNGTQYLLTKATLTPRMISDWAMNSLNTSTVIVELKELNKTGLSGGDISAIVIGSCLGAAIVSLVAVVLLKMCAYGMGPAMAAPKMMM